MKGDCFRPQRLTLPRSTFSVVPNDHIRRVAKTEIIEEFSTTWSARNNSYTIDIVYTRGSKAKIGALTFTVRK
ncbi:hypothetical protein Pta6605_16240 [Pseudomonas amygdali pv. tabaci]|nr:hypothetical protein Pta6605_16240 [Pseudomonas amygdali pv. tabaci]